MDVEPDRVPKTEVIVVVFGTGTALFCDGLLGFVRCGWQLL